MRYVVRERFFRIGEDNDITDDQGNPVYQVDGKLLSLRQMMIVNDLQGNQVAQVHRKLVSVLPHYEIDFPNTAEPTEVHQRFSNPLKPKWTISQPGQPDMDITGNFFGHNFTIERGEQQVATVSKQWVTLTDTYGIDIADNENDLLILCSVLALEAEQDQKSRNNFTG
jgi:uncharacterized protein YxjI